MKKTKKRKHNRIKLPKYKRVRKDTWEKMSLFVRMRDHWTCITCGKSINPSKKSERKKMHCGHLVHMNCYDFREDALACQCGTCNYNMKNGPRDGAAMINKFKEEMDKRYGPGHSQMLVDNRHQEVKLTRSDLMAIQEKLDGKIALLMTDEATK